MATQAHAQARASEGQPCLPRQGVLGVSRVLEIDTSRGPRFGQLHYSENDFLRENEIVLTFDDGPQRRNTRLVLDALSAHCTRATFFMVGQMALSDPDMVREVAREGHTIGVHTWSHRNLRATGKIEANREIELGISAVQRALGQPVAPFFRFPYLADSQSTNEHLASRSIAVFSIDADSKDFRTRDPREMRRTIMGALTQRGKGILLFHDIQQSTALGIRAVLDELASRNFKVVHLVAKDSARSQPSFDAMAEAELSRRSKLATAAPLAQRAVVWPMAAPSAAAEVYRPDGMITGKAAGQSRGTSAKQAPAATPIAAPMRPAAGEPGSAQQQRNPAAPAAQAAPNPESAPQPAPRPEFRGTDDDWRTRVFQH